MDSIDTGDQIFGRRRFQVMATEPEGVEDTEGHVAGDQVFDRRRFQVMATEPEGVEDTEGHTFRTYPGAVTDDELDCRMPLPGEEDERMRHL